MPRQSVESRVETLDTRVTMLEELPARMDRLESQIVQLRAENAAEHSAIRQDIQTFGAELRTEMQELGTDIRAEMRGLRADMQRLNEEQKRHTSVLFEEALSRIAAMNEGRLRSRKRKA